MEYLFIVIQSSLTTMCLIALGGVYYLAKMSAKHEKASRKIVEDLTVAHNTNQETIKNLIGEINDVKTQIAMTRAQSRRTL